MVVLFGVHARAPVACVATGANCSANGRAHVRVRTATATRSRRAEIRGEAGAICVLPLPYTPSCVECNACQRTKKDTVNEALREYIQRRRQAKVVELFGKIDFDSSYDYKKQRRRS